MKRSAFITAVSGSGKSTVCKSLAEHCHEAYDIESIQGLFSLVDINTNQIITNKQIADLEEGVEADWLAAGGISVNAEPEPDVVANNIVGLCS